MRTHKEGAKRMEGVASATPRLRYCASWKFAAAGDCRPPIPGPNEFSAPLKPSPLELLFQIAKGEAQGRRPPMRAIAGAIDQFATGEQRFDFRRGKRITRFHRGFAGHHVEHFVKQLFFVHVQQLLFPSLEKLADKCAGLQLFQK